jgi:hypothetical protein
VFALGVPGASAAAPITVRCTTLLCRPSLGVGHEHDLACYASLAK